MRKLIFLFFFLLILFFVSAEGKHIMRIEPSVSITKSGETIAVNISIQPSDAIRGAQCVSYSIKMYCGQKRL